MAELFLILDAAMQWLIVPAAGVFWYLHREQRAILTEMAEQKMQIAVMRAEATARDLARAEDRETTSKQLDQILVAVNTLSGRVDLLMKEK